jgi:hypothetical protein
VAVNCVAVGLAMVWPNIARSTDSQTVTARVDFDHTFASVTPLRRETILAIDFEQARSGLVIMPRGASTPAVDFDQAFNSVTTSRRGNTPPNREKLRNAGWKRILGPG